ncbi:hypothetical protein ACOSQ4_024700 [Xanthoceras sorbifolium]
MVIPLNEDEVVASPSNAEADEHVKAGESGEVPAVDLREVECSAEEIAAPLNEVGMATTVITEDEPDRVKCSLKKVIRTAVPLSFVTPAPDTVREPMPTIPLVSKRETLIIGASPDEGPIHGHDYSSFTSVGKKEIILCDDNDDNDLADEDAVSISLLMKKGNPSIGKNVDESSS